MSKKTSTSDLLIGTILDDKYKLERHIGRGGMGSVYIAHHTKFNKQVAVKVLSRDMTEDPTCYERFKREADASARIKHPNAVSVIDFGQTSDDVVYLVMEYVEGLTLRKLLEREKRLTPDRTVNLARQICAGIGAAHRANIVHRDLKPDNVMIEIIDGQEVVKVLDFGIAKLKDSQQQNQITKTDSVLGTPHYMSPEQCSGGTIDYLSDIYSLGIILYEMLSGHVPFQATSAPAVIVQHVTKDPTPLKKLCPDVPEPLSHVVMRALDKQPSRRQHSALDLANQLEAALTISGISNTPRKTVNDASQWRVVFHGVLDNSESGQRKLLDGLQRSFGLSESSAQELLKGKKLSVKKTPSHQEAIKVAEKLRAIGADVKIEPITEKPLELNNSSNNAQTIAYQQEQKILDKSEDKTLEAKSVSKNNPQPKVEITYDPLLVTDGSEMLTYATEQYSKSKAASSVEAETIQTGIDKPSSTQSQDNLITSSKGTQYQTSKMPPKVWQIDINGFIYENQTPEDVEAMIRAGRIRHTHKARLGNTAWQDVGTIPEFRQIIEQINPHAFQPLTAMEEQAKKEENEQATRIFIRRMAELCAAVLVIYIVVTFTMQYSQRRLLEDDLRVVLGDSNITVQTLRSRVNTAIEQRGLKIPKEDVHITVDPSNHQVVVHVDYKRTILAIPLNYQAKRGIGNFNLPIEELASLPEGELDIIGLAPGEIEKYRREQAIKKAAEKLATYQGEPATLKERDLIKKEISQFESALQLFNVTSVDDKGNQSYSKSIKINNQEYDKEQTQTRLTELKTKLADLEYTLEQQRIKKKLELESQIEKPSTIPSTTPSSMSNKSE
ncbi:MAG: serine/threonine protein kinase [Acidobacteria bacterium]|nr:serine/threonine protein kinase [Acidobacteriota bacterium]